MKLDRDGARGILGSGGSPVSVWPEFGRGRGNNRFAARLYRPVLHPRNPAAQIASRSIARVTPAGNPAEKTVKANRLRGFKYDGLRGFMDGVPAGSRFFHRN